MAKEQNQREEPGDLKNSEEIISRVYREGDILVSFVS